MLLNKWKKRQADKAEAATAAAEQVSATIDVTTSGVTTEVTMNMEAPVEQPHPAPILDTHIMHVDPANPHKITVKQLIQNGTQYVVVPRERPDTMSGTTYKTNTPYGNLFVTVNDDQYGPFEVFAQLGKAGGFFSALSEAICRLISLSLRSGVAVDEVVKQVKGIRSSEVAFANGEVIYSLPDAIGKVLERHVQRNQQSLQLAFKSNTEIPLSQLNLETASGNGIPISAASEAQIAEEQVQVTATVQSMSQSATLGTATVEQKISIANFGYAPVCPVCSMMLKMQEGCMKCDSCGYSKCG